MSRVDEIKSQIGSCLFHECPCAKDTEWLLSRVSKLEEALKHYSTQTTICSHGVVEYDIGEIAREALKDQAE